jgi:alpha-methylacyl-CoA racemase
MTGAGGPLEGIRILELGGIGPAPFGIMLLADLGAEVIRVDRVADVGNPLSGALGMGILLRGRRSVGLDLKQPEAVELVLDMVEASDVLVEGFRPGVAERLGIGPDVCTARNPRLVYARMTGWGQSGPLADRAGHDLNYVGLAGALHAIGRADSPPPPPLNLIADFGGGGAYLALGVLAALLEREQSGQGQVIDVAMVDGVSSLSAMFHGMIAKGMWITERQANLLDGGVPFYDTYETADGGYVSVAALEPQFYLALLATLELDPGTWSQMDRDRWPALREELTRIFASRSRDEWAKLFENVDACVAPVLTFEEARDHPQMVERGTFVEVDGVRQPAAAPRFSRTPGSVGPLHELGADTDEVLAELGIAPERLAELRAARAVT